MSSLHVVQATERGIQVSNIPSGACGNALSCAEMAIYLSLCCLRYSPGRPNDRLIGPSLLSQLTRCASDDLDTEVSFWKNRQAKELATSVQNRALGVPIGDTLHGKTCLMVGFGNIAKELAPR